MREIIEIMYKEKKIAKSGRSYILTTALLHDGEEAIGFGEDFRVGDPVEVFLHKGVIKMQRGHRKST